MRRVTSYVVLGAVLAATATFGWAAAPYERKVGFLVPSQCKPVEGAKKPDGPYDDWPAPHTTECALRDACIRSGYGLWTGERFLRFDDRGQEMALDYFKTTPRTSYHKVEVTGVFTEDRVEVKRLRMTD